MRMHGLILTSIVAGCTSISVHASDTTFSSNFLKLSGCNAWVQHCVDDSPSHDESTGSQGKVKAKDVLRLVLDALIPGEARITYLSNSAKPHASLNESRWEVKLGISYEGTQLMLRQDGNYAGFSLRGAPADVDDNVPFTQVRFEIRW